MNFVNHEILELEYRIVRNMAARFEVERFDGKADFVLWKMRMKALILLQQRGLPETTTTTTTAKDRVQEMENIAFSTIIFHLEDNVLLQVSDVETSEELWERLEQLFSRKSFRDRLYLKERFFGYKMDSSKNIEDNLEEFTKIAWDFSRIGAEVSDEDQAVILLSSLPSMYNEVKDSLIHGVRDSLTVGMVVNALRAKDKEMNEKRQEGIERGRKCYHCQKEGHIRRNCPTLRKSKEWILSSGCTMHMTPNKNYLIDFVETEETKVNGFNDQFEVKGVGLVKIKTDDGQIRTLSNVKYVPNLTRNVISLGVLDDKGCFFMGDEGTLKIYKDSSLILKSKLTNGLYILEGSAITN